MVFEYIGCNQDVQSFWFLEADWALRSLEHFLKRLRVCLGVMRLPGSSLNVSKHGSYARLRPDSARSWSCIQGSPDGVARMSRLLRIWRGHWFW